MAAVPILAERTEEPANAWSSERRAWLRLARSRGVGATLFCRLIERFGKAEAALAALPRLKAKGELDSVELLAEAAVEEELEALASLGGELLLSCDPAYPAALAAIADPPPVLALQGRIELLARRPLAIVGARNASGNGRFLARALAREASQRDLVIVSGLARGIDTAAHEGGLEGPGSTIAVLGSGIDVAYPPENAELLARIATDGLVVSERPIGTPPLARHFPSRNRIIAGLASAVLVVEAAARSGSLMTARLAAAEGREVLAVPGSPLDPRHAGTNQLLRDGAALVTSIDDVLEALPAWSRPSPPAEPPPRAPRRAAKPRAAPPVERPVAPAPALPDRIAVLVGVEPMPVDEVIRQCHATPAEVQQALLDLELDGRVRRHPGNRISRALA
ncbi:MAG: DNA-processing protein DprA [Geminicoccaceae bacterium]